MAKLVHCPAYRGILETPLALSSGHVLLNCIAVEGMSYALPISLNVDWEQGSGKGSETSQLIAATQEEAQRQPTTSM